MRVPIFDNIIMTSDPHNIILNREMVTEKGENKGKKYLAAYAYFPTVIQALESVLAEKMGESTARTLKGLIQQHQELLGELRGLLGTIVEVKP